MTGIISALKIEIELIEEKIENAKTETISGIAFRFGTINGNEVVAAVCGVGKVHAALCAQTMILKWNPSLIINVGVAGSLSETLDVTDVVAATSVVQHDMDTSPLGDKKGMISGINVINIDCDSEANGNLCRCMEKLNIRHTKGVVASGDQFICDKDKKKWIAETFDAKACEMEGAAIGHVCYINKTPFTVLRAISDKADGEADISFLQFAEIAAKNSARIINAYFTL